MKVFLELGIFLVLLFCFIMLVVNNNIISKNYHNILEQCSIEHKGD